MIQKKLREIVTVVPLDEKAECLWHALSKVESSTTFQEGNAQLIFCKYLCNGYKMCDKYLNRRYKNE